MVNYRYSTRITSSPQIADLYKKMQITKGERGEERICCQRKLSQNNCSYHGYINAITKSVLKHLQKLWTMCSAYLSISQTCGEQGVIKNMNEA